MKNMKYKVLAADDEFWSRENIRNLIPWEEYSLEFLEPACDGEEVIERIAEEKPDIILTDINMPFLSGLELLQRLQNEYPEIITIAISGYDDFDKVKGVFVSGGLDYLLKPVGKEEMVKVLTKALGLLEERENTKKQDETSKLQKHKLSSFLEDSEYSALLSGKLYGQSASQTHVSSTNTFSEVATLMVKFYNITEIAEQFEHDNLQMSWNIKSRLRELTGLEENAIIFNNSNKMSEFLIVKTADAKEFRALAENILKEFPLEEYGPVSVVLHEQTSSLDDIGTVYRELISTLITRPFNREHSILSCPEEKTGELPRNSETQMVGKSAPAHMETELYHLLTTGQKAEAEKLIFKTCNFRQCDDGNWTYLDVKQYAGRITGILYRYVQEKCPELTAQAEEAMDNIDYYMKCLNAPSLLASLKILLDSLWESGEDKSSDAGSIMQQVEQIHKYIERSYHENITLTALAEQYHMDASYLSRIFSQKYGDATFQQRWKGYKQAVDEWNEANPDDQATITEPVYANTSSEEGAAAALSLYNSNPDMDALIVAGGGGDPLVGSIGALANEGLTGKIDVVSTDFLDDLGEQLESGGMFAESGGHFCDPLYAFLITYNAIKGNYVKDEGSFGYEIQFPYLYVSSSEDYENYKKYFVDDDPYTDEELVELAGYSFDDLNKAATSLSIEDVISRHSN